MKDMYRVRGGRLMRCCLQSLDDAMVAAEQPPQEGDRVPCKFCQSEYGMVFRDGAWEWSAPKVRF